MSLLKDKLELGVEEGELKLQKQLQIFPPLIKWLVIAAAIAIIPAYFVAEAASFSYWKKDLSNFELAAKPSFQNPQAPQVSSTTLLSLATGTYAAVATVSNPNLDLYLGSSSYTFNFYDAQKNLIYTVSQPFFLLPNQLRYVVVAKFQSSAPPAASSLTFAQPLNWQKPLSIPQVDLSTGIPDFYNQIDPLTFVVEDTVYNNSPYQLGSVLLTFLLYDKNNNLVGASQRTEFTLAPFERRAFKQLWPGTDGGDITSVKVLAETDPLQSGNLTVPANNSGASQLNAPPSNDTQD